MRKREECGMERQKYSLNSAKHASKMAEWKIRIGECRNSGQTIKDWCRGNNVNRKTYYRWQRLIWDAETENRTIEPVKTGAIQFAEIPQIRIETERQQAGIIVRKGEWRIELQNNANPVIICQILEMVAQDV